MSDTKSLGPTEARGRAGALQGGKMMMGAEPLYGKSAGLLRALDDLEARNPYMKRMVGMVWVELVKLWAALNQGGLHLNVVQEIPGTNRFRGELRSEDGVVESMIVVWEDETRWTVAVTLVDGTEVIGYPAARCRHCAKIFCPEHGVLRSSEHGRQQDEL